MRDLRKAGAWFLALLLVVLAGDRIAAAGLNALLLRSHFRFSEIYRGGVDADIIVLGDSRGVTSFNVPAVEKRLGVRAFSLCFNGMATRIAEAWLNDYLDHNRPPRLVVIEVTSAVEPMKLSPELRTYAGMSPRMAALYAEEHPIAARVGRVFKLLSFNSELFLRSLYYLRRPDQDWGNPATISTTEVALARTSPPWTLQMKQENLDSLERMLRMLHARNIEVRLLIGPYLPQHLQRLDNLQPFIAAVSGRARRVDPAIRVWNYAGAVDDPRLFADVLHLNAAGTEELMAMLQRDGFFQTHSSPMTPLR